MNYIFDTNSLSNEILYAAKGRSDFFITEEVLDERTRSEDEKKRLLRSNIKILYTEIRHLYELKEILRLHGANLKLIRMYSGEGSADVLILAHILSDQEEERFSLFPQTWSIITDDAELSKIAQQYGINVFSSKEFLVRV